MLQCSIVWDTFVNMKEQQVKIARQETLKTHVPSITPEQYPAPSTLVEMAEHEPERKRVDEYAEVISKLRDEKGFTYRAIAEWLCEHGVPTDHNEVYRTHKDWCEGAPKRYLERNRQQKMPGQS
jgi:hypothetical protein